jgi:myo-inositol catabolism protein IolS
MEYVKLGKSDLMVSKIGLGTWQFGDKDWGWGTDYGEREALEVIERALDLGINFIDTAEVYGDGLSETIVGKAIAGKRDKVILATKVSGHHLQYEDVLRAAEGSLKRLNTDFIDLYQIHWPSWYYPLEETMRALEKLVEEGKVRYLGLSNFSPPLIREARRALARAEIISNQVRYNLLQREIEKGILPYCKRRGISIIAWSPLAKGLLTGKFHEGNLPQDELRKEDPLFAKRENLQQALKLVEVLKEIALNHGKTVAQVALNWLIAQPGVIAIPGAKRPAQVEENAGACGWKLSEEEQERIAKAASEIRMNYF